MKDKNARLLISMRMQNVHRNDDYNLSAFPLIG